LKLKVLFNLDTPTDFAFGASSAAVFLAFLELSRRVPMALLRGWKHF
jgi:hypothetical protein